MSAAFGSSGTGASGTTSATPTLPAALVDGEMLVAWATTKYAAPDVAPTGWVQFGTISGGHGSSGSNTGQVTVTGYYRISAGKEANSTAYTWTVTGGNSIRVNISRYTKAEGEQWVTPAAASCQNNTPGTAWSGAATTNPGLAAGDLILSCAGVNSSAFTYSSQAYAATGCTFGTVGTRFANQVNTGDHLEPVSCDATVSTGPATAAPTFSMTASGSATDAPAGATLFVRLRTATTSKVAYIAGAAAVSGGATTMTATYPSGITAGQPLIVAVMGKYPTNYPVTPSGYSILKIARSNSGLGNAADSGDVWVATYLKIATGSETGTLSISVPSGNVIAGTIIQVSVASGYSAEVVADGTSDDTSHTAVSLAFANLGFVTDDLVFAILCGNNSVGGQTNAGLVATGIAAQLTNRAYAQSAGGDKCRDNLNTLTIQGVATAGPTFSYTAANATVVAGVLIRIRGVLANIAAEHKYARGIARGISRGIN